MSAIAIAAFAYCALLPLSSEHPATLLWDHGAHTQPSAEERALRELLTRYSHGDTDGAVRGVLQKPLRWVAAAVDLTTRRSEEEIKYHRRPANRLSAAQDERLERYLRADRLNVLLLSAALQLDTARAATALEVIGWNVIDSERAIDALWDLRSDLQDDGPVPWPVAIDEPWESVTGGGSRTHGALDWPIVRTFVARWYPAATSRLQEIVEMHLLPALVARGLARFPGDPDLLLARGSFAETRLALAQIDSSLASVVYPPDIRQRWHQDLSDARQDFEDAVRAAGPSSEAAVRLGRVQLLLGQTGRTRELLDRVLSGDASSQLRYLALMFRAEAAEQDHLLQSATRDYEAALEAIPDAQTPMLALARIADEQGDGLQARRWIERALMADMASVDPWRRYIQGQGAEGGSRFVLLLRAIQAH